MNQRSGRRGWVTCILLALVGAIVLGLPTGFALFILSHGSMALLVGTPVALFAFTLAALRYLSPLPNEARLRRLRRAAFVSTAVLGALVFDVLVVLGVVQTESRCTWEYSDEIAATTTLGPSGQMRADRSTPYADAIDDVDTFIKHSLVLRMAEPQWRAPTTTVRTVTIDLSQPVAGSGAVSRGIVSGAVSFKSFWHRLENGMIRTVHAIPIGTTVPSARTEVELMIDGKEHYLTMGEWALGHCEYEAPIHGAGTSPAAITRLGEEDFRVDTPAGGVARLWDTAANPPVDKGLYVFNLQATFSAEQPV